VDPLQKHVEEMRDLYAAEILAARESGEIPSPMVLESWAKYDAAARDEDPGRALAPGVDGADPGGTGSPE
jgi:hypothetical protein